MSYSYPQPRRRHPKSGMVALSNRDSSAVRASVLETALELGIAQNSTVANWIFNTPLAEVPEDVSESHGDPEPEVEESLTPALTCGSNTTSDESSLNSPRNNTSSAGISASHVHARKPSATESPHVHFGDFSSDQLQLFSPLSLAPANASKANGDLSGQKLRETELIDGNPRPHDRPIPAEVGYSSEGQSLSKGKGGKKGKKTKKSKPKALDLGKSEDRETDYTSDGGYLSASSNKSQGKSPSKGKSRAIAFFRRRPKKSQRGSDDEDDDDIPPVPAIPPMPRPSSPKPLKHHGTAPSPTRTGFTPLTLNFSSPPASPPRRRTSKSPPPPHTALVPSSLPRRPSKESLHSLQPTSPVPASISAAAIVNPAPATLQAPSPAPHLMPASPSAPSSTATVAGLASKSATLASSRHHHPIPPPAPPPTFPPPQPPSPRPSTPSRTFQPSKTPSAPTTPSRRAPSRPVPSLPIPTAPILTPPIFQTPPLTPLKESPLRSPWGIQPSAKVDQVHYRQFRNEGDYMCNFDHVSQGCSVQSSSMTTDGHLGKAPQLPLAKQQPEILGQHGSAHTPMFLQRRIHGQQHTHPSSPRLPPPDAPLPQLPPTPSPTPSARLRTPVTLPSKFHESFSSVSSVPFSHILSAPSASPTSSISRSGSSGPSVRSLHTSSTPSEHGYGQQTASRGTPDSRPVTSSSSTSEVSYGRVVTSTFNNSHSRLVSRFSDRSEVSVSVYPPTSQDNTSVYDDDANVEEVRDGAIDEDEDDDASVYPSEEQTAGRRTMYLVEHGHLDENGDEVVISNHYWNGGQPLPPLPTHPHPGYI